tara:strand:- start:191 stop:298 length:108 start_codon:yes stop_codon:yes gene_type:complete
MGIKGKNACTVKTHVAIAILTAIELEKKRCEKKPE